MPASSRVVCSCAAISDLSRALTFSAAAMSSCWQMEPRRSASFMATTSLWARALSVTWITIPTRPPGACTGHIV